MGRSEGSQGLDHPDPLSPSVAAATDPAGPSYAAATLQASSATSSPSAASRAVGSTSKVRLSPGWVEREERVERPQLILTPQLQESPKRKRKLDLNQEERKTPSKPSAQPSPPAIKRPKREHWLPCSCRGLCSYVLGRRLGLREEGLGFSPNSTK